MESRNTENTYDFYVLERNVLLPLSFNVFQHKERERHNLSILAFSSAPLPSRATPAKGLREQLSSNSQNPPSASGAWRHLHCVAPFLISGYCDISEWHVRSARVDFHVVDGRSSVRKIVNAKDGSLQVLGLLLFHFIGWILTWFSFDLW